MTPWVKALCSLEGNQFAQRFRCETLGKNHVRRPVAFEDPVGHHPIGRTLGFDLPGGLAEGQRFGLCEYVCQKHVVMPAEGIQGFDKSDLRELDDDLYIVGLSIQGLLKILRLFPPCNQLAQPCPVCARQRLAGFEPVPLVGVHAADQRQVFKDY